MGRHQKEHGAAPMERDRLVEELCQIYGSEEKGRIEQVVSQIPDGVLDHLFRITKGQNGPAHGEYDKETKTIILYEDTFNPRVLVHEMGHCIYHEIPGIADATKDDYRNDIGLPELTDESLVEAGAAEFCANAYQLYKTKTVSTEDGPERYQDLASKLRERGL